MGALRLRRRRANVPSNLSHVPSYCDHPTQSIKRVVNWTIHEGLGTTITWMKSGGREVDARWTRGGLRGLRAVPEYKYRRNIPREQFSNWSSWVLTILWTSGVLPGDRALYDEVQYVISSIWLQTPPPHVHLASTWRHSRARCSQAFPIVRAHPLPCIILNTNQKKKTGEAWKWGYRTYSNKTHDPI